MNIQGEVMTFLGQVVSNKIRLYEGVEPRNVLYPASKDCNIVYKRSTQAGRMVTLLYEVNNCDKIRLYFKGCNIISGSKRPRIIPHSSTYIIEQLPKLTVKSFINRPECSLKTPPQDALFE
ncbi:uncharacterized protein DS421_13g440270 [Arachis hypogaea]|nr:uncharacterized protein DS421_13g440270 [Arachis hypogaea]